MRYTDEQLATLKLMLETGKPMQATAWNGTLPAMTVDGKQVCGYQDATVLMYRGAVVLRGVSKGGNTYVLTEEGRRVVLLMALDVTEWKE